MKAMVLNRPCNLKENHAPLTLEEIPNPEPKENEILVKVSACGVCHTELDEIEDRTPPPRLPVILGHQVVGIVSARGRGTSLYKIGDRVGIAWIYSACGECKFCLAGNENLCPHFQATGRDADGGYAQYMTVPEAFACRIPDIFSNSEAAPLLCAGAIGYRSLRLTGLRNGQNLGLTGFGASGHLVLMMLKHQYPNARAFVFARSAEQREFAKALGAAWVGEIAEEPPEKHNSIIHTTPAWKPEVTALRHLYPGGRLVVNAIRKEEVDKEYLLQLDYPDHLWMEKEIKSVANVSRKDVTDFLRLAGELGITPEIQEYPLEEANKALVELKMGKNQGAKVLRIQ